MRYSGRFVKDYFDYKNTSPHLSRRGVCVAFRKHLNGAFFVENVQLVRVFTFFIKRFIFIPKVIISDFFCVVNYFA